jgi:hypothetical protein
LKPEEIVEYDRQDWAEGRDVMSIEINKINEMFVVEWNAGQKVLQIQALGAILKSNLRAAVNGRNSGYSPIAIAHTEEEALKISKLIEAKLKMRRREDSSDTLH